MAALEDLGDIVARVTADGTWPPGDELLRSVGLQPVEVPSSHVVCRVEVDGTPCCLKLYRSWARGEPAREWALLELLAGSDLAPTPVWRSDDERWPAVVTTWLDGEPLSERAQLTNTDIDSIANAHRVIHRLRVPDSMPLALSAGAVVVSRVVEWWPDLGALAEGLGASSSALQRLAAEPHSMSDPVERLLERATRTVCRGDTNLANYLSSAAGLRLVDFEDSGLAEPVFELADMAEHFANRGQGEHAWERLARETGIAADDLLVARGVVAEFWLALTIRRLARGLVMRPPTSPDDQVRRVESLTRR